MRATLLTIGDELLIGQVLNSNAQWIGNKLTEIGIRMDAQLTVGDNESSICDALTYLKPRSDIVLIGGGLGPTHDDITLEVLSKHFGIPQEYDQDWISQVEAYFKSRNRVMAENNKKQALLLKTATRIDNDCGTAAGQYFTADHVQYFVFPGVPHEMQSMMDRFVLPILEKQQLKSGERILKKTLMTTGMGESALALRCDPFVQKIKKMPNVSLAFLPSSTLVRLRLQMRAKNPQDDLTFQSLVNELIQFCDKDFFGFEPTTVEEVIIEKLKKTDATLSVAESCTGGLIAHQLTQVSGASNVFRGSITAYQNRTKTAELGISEAFINEHGVVSEKVALSMAESIRKKWNSTYSISTTGYLGPSGGTTDAPTGTVWVAIAGPNGTTARKFHFESHRGRGKERATQSALDLLRRELTGTL